MSNQILTNQRAFAYAQVSGVLTIMFLGMAAAAALVIGAIWLLAQVALLALQSLTECISTIGSTYQGADAFTRFLILVSIGYVVYRVLRRVFTRR